MNFKTSFLKTRDARFVCGAALLLTLAGCAAYVDGPRAHVQVESPVFVEQDDYLFYPGYNVYYSSRRHQYAYQQGGAWVSRPAPPGVSVDVLLASPSVRMDFHDSPANHHAAVVRQYPKNWSPPRANPVRQENQRDDKRDERNAK